MRVRSGLLVTNPRLWDIRGRSSREKLNYRLRRIEREGDLPQRSLLDHADFVPLDPHFGVCLFVVEAIQEKERQNG